MSSGTRNRAASRIQSAARRSRITRSLTGQLEEFLTHLSQSPNVILLEILNVNPPNPPNTLTLMVDTLTRNGATKRLLLCIDVGADRKIIDINTNCIKDAMPAGGLAFTHGYGSRYSEMGPNPYGGPSILQRVNSERLVGVQNQFHNEPMTKQRGFFQYSPNVRTRYPLVTQLGLSPQELLDILEGGNYCNYPVFKRICTKLRKKIKNGETYKPPPRELKAIQEIFSGSLGGQASWVAGGVTNVADAVRVSTPSVSTRSYGSDDIRNLMNGELGNDEALEWLEMSPRYSPPMSPNTQIRLFPSSDDIPPPPSSTPPSPPPPPRLPRTRGIYGRNSPPSGSPPARRARRR